jgi:glycosyl transferase family 25
MKKIQVFIISLKNSQRIHILKKRLKDIRVNYKIFNGINGINFYKKKKLHLIYSKRLTKKNIDRELSPSEVGAAASHLAIYKNIIQKNIDQAIIMEDDAYPSELINKWIKNNTSVENNEIISFYSYPSSGFLKKKSKRYIFKNKIKIYNSSTHIFNNSCYQINNYTCKRIIKLTKNKVIGLPDWPFLINKHNIKLSVTIPYLTIIDDKNISHLRNERANLLKNNKFIKRILPEKIISLLRIPYYLTYLAFFLKFKNKEFYYEHYFQKQLFRLKNFFTREYLDVNKIYYDKNYYAYDLKKFIKTL